MPSLGMSDTGPRTGHAQLSRLPHPIVAGQPVLRGVRGVARGGNALAVSERTNTWTANDASSIDTACYFFS